MTRDEAARAFAEKMGWRVGPPETVTRWFGTGTLWGKDQGLVYFPAPDAPLHEHLAFVGRVAEAIGPLDRVDALGSRNRFHCCGCTGAQWWVKFYERNGRVGLEYSARDLSHAALLAALAALEAR